MKTLAGLALWIGVTAAAAAVGGAASVQSPAFYAQLARPSWAPPAAIFGPVWTLLYLLMAVAAFLVWRERGRLGTRGALALYVVQLALNAVWTWLFFAWRNGALAFADIIVLLAFIVATVVAFWRIRPLAGALLLPYLAWTTFATALTWTIWRANPTLL